MRFPTNSENHEAYELCLTPIPMLVAHLTSNNFPLQYESSCTHTDTGTGKHTLQAHTHADDSPVTQKCGRHCVYTAVYYVFIHRGKY